MQPHSLKLSRFFVRSVLMAFLGVFPFFALAQVGGLDPAFAPGAILNGAAAGEVRALSVRSDNSVIVAGAFTTIGGVARGNIARLTYTGALDASFASGVGANGPINVMVVQNDGKIVIAGEFQSMHGVARGNIARLNADGSLDTTFATGAGANGPVYALLLNGSSFYIGGDFTAYNGTSRGRLARLSPSGALDSNFSVSTGANAAVRGIAMDTFGTNLYVAGAFTSWSGSARSRLARVSTFGGSLDFFFNRAGGPDGTVHSILAVGDFNSPSLVIAGEFSSVSGVPRGRFAVLSASFGPDSPVLQPISLDADGPVRTVLPTYQSTIAPAPLYVGGDFTKINEFPRGGFARFKNPTHGGGSSSTSLEVDPAFHVGAGANGSIRAFGLQADGKLIVGGSFNSIAGAAVQPLVRLYGDAGSLPPPTPTGLLVDAVGTNELYLEWSYQSFVTGFKVERSPDGINGWSQVGAQSSPFVNSGLLPGTTYFYRVIATNSNGDSVPSSVASSTTLTTPWVGPGSLDPASASFTGVDGYIYAVAVQPDGKVVIAGTFGMVNGVVRKKVARINTDWTVDSSFDPGAGPDSSVQALAVHEGKVIIGGIFSSVGGVPRKNVARLLSNGSLDTSFDPGTGADSLVNSIAVQKDGRMIVGGSFGTFGNSSHPGIVRLNENGTVDESFSANSFTSVQHVAIQRDGCILLCDSTQEVVRLKPDGKLDSTFNPGDPLSVDNFAALNNGQVMIVGIFDALNGPNRNGIARLNADGTVDPSFNANLPSPYSSIGAVAQQPNGKIVVVGFFSRLGSTLRLHIARFLADGTIDPGFQPGLGADYLVDSLAIGTDGSIIVAGSFSKIGGVTQNGIARLRGDVDTTIPGVPLAGC